MKTYTVHHKTGDADRIAEQPEQVIFVAEAFNWVALFIPFIWLLFQRMWIVAALFLAALVLVATVGMFLELSSWVMFLLNGGLNLFIALNGNELRRWSLQRRGLKMIDIVSSKTQDECELKFFHRLNKTQAAGPQTSTHYRAPQRLASQPGESGMFPITGADA